MEATVLDQGRKTSKKCQIEGCHEITVGSRTALCRKHRNNKYKQNYNKKRKRKALGPEVSIAYRSLSVSMVKCAILLGNFNFDNKAYFFVKLEGVTLYRSHMSLSSTFQFCHIAIVLYPVSILSLYFKGRIQQVSLLNLTVDWLFPPLRFFWPGTVD